MVTDYIVNRWLAMTGLKPIFIMEIVVCLIYNRVCSLFSWTIETSINTWLVSTYISISVMNSSSQQHLWPHILYLVFNSRHKIHQLTDLLIFWVLYPSFYLSLCTDFCISTGKQQKIKSIIELCKSFIDNTFTISIMTCYQLISETNHL